MFLTRKAGLKQCSHSDETDISLFVSPLSSSDTRERNLLHSESWVLTFSPLGLIAFVSHADQLSQEQCLAILELVSLH